MYTVSDLAPHNCFQDYDYYCFLNLSWESDSSALLLKTGRPRVKAKNLWSWWWAHKGSWQQKQLRHFLVNPVKSPKAWTVVCEHSVCCLPISTTAGGSNRCSRTGQGIKQWFPNRERSQLNERQDSPCAPLQLQRCRLLNIKGYLRNIQWTINSRANKNIFEGKSYRGQLEIIQLWMISFPLPYIKDFFVEIMRSLFSGVFTLGNSCGERHKQRTLPYLGAHHCDKCIDGDRKNPSIHTPITKQKWQSQTKTASHTKHDVKQLILDYCISVAAEKFQCLNQISSFLRESPKT